MPSLAKSQYIAISKEIDMLGSFTATCVRRHGACHTLCGTADPKMTSLTTLYSKSKRSYSTATVKISLTGGSINTY